MAKSPKSKSTRLELRLDDEVLKMLDDLIADCPELDLSRSAMIRALIRKAHGKRTPKKS